MEILSFFAGIVFVYTLSFKALVLPIFFIILTLRWRLLYWFLGAVIWALLHLYFFAELGTPKARVLANVQLEGKVVSIPEITQTKSQFQFLISSLDGRPASSRILLACYNRCPVFKAGQIWRLNAKLKRPQKPGNPGSFNYKTWLDSRHIAWTGYVKNKTLKQLHDATNESFLLKMRESLGKSLADKITDLQILGVVQALTLGLTSFISKTDWDLFRRTGTTHLMVISGAHIGLVAGLCYWCVFRLWSRAGSLSLPYPAMKIASILSLLMATSYALLAGFAAPAQRALLACFFMSMRYFLSRRITSWQAWRYGLLLVLLYEPHVVLLSGFYFSFLAVAILILCSQRYSLKGLSQMIILQLACLAGLMPLTLYWFSYGAVNGFFANLLAIPWVGFVVVPLALLSLCLAVWTSNPTVFIPVQWSVQWLLNYLHWVDGFSQINFNYTFPGLGIPLIFLGALLLAVILPFKQQALVVTVLVLSACFPAYQHVPSNSVQVDVLDVGQGLAILVRTKNHQLLYDTGPRFYQGSDMGQLVIIPYLRQLGIKKLDRIVISHPDLDHRGGLLSVEKAIAVDKLEVDKPAFYHRGYNCHQSPAWRWDTVSFQFLGIEERFRDKNNSSCVLQIKTATQTILLTGDIEKKAEQWLIRRFGGALKANLLVIPHHGSKTSSSVDFIKAVSPQIAIISSGFDNRYHFPHATTLKTLSDFKINVYNTADYGMVSYIASGTNKESRLSCFAAHC